MWCRVLLVAIALTCTFQREILAEPERQSTQRIDQIKDVICVLMLTGLQKEDLEASVVEKLQRHNVNIDDMDNETIRETCTIYHSEAANRNRFFAKETTPVIREDEKTSISQTQKLEYNFLKTSFIVERSEENNNDRNKNIDNTKQEDVEVETAETTTKTFTEQGLVSWNKETQNGSQVNDLEYINKMLESYFATKLTQTTTPQPTTTEKVTTSKLHIDIISQKIKEYLDNNRNKPLNVQHKRAPILQPTIKAYKANSIENKRSNVQETFSNKYITDILKLNDEIRRSKLRSNIPQSPQTHPSEENVLQRDAKIVETDLRPLPDDVIREIAEKVKASVLKDLRTQITSTFNLTATMKTTTEISPTTTTLTNDQNKIIDANGVLQTIIELFQQLKLVKGGITPPEDMSFKLTHKKDTKNEFHGPINVLYPPMLPPNYAYGIGNDTSNVTSLFLNPYNHVSIVNSPVIQKNNLPKQTNKKTVNAKTSFQALSNNDFKPVKNVGAKLTLQSMPITIQSDGGEIPPLGIPVPHSVKAMNQHIIVTTKHPMMQLREEQYRNGNKMFKQQVYAARDGDRYESDLEGNYEQPAYSQRDRPLQKNRERDRGQGFVPSIRQYSNNFHKEYIGNRPSAGEYHKRERNRERFHEILERPEKWRGSYRHEHRSTPDNKLKIASRQQMSLSDLKKKSRYDDTPFKNFLKTQKKVNEMLEQILATKTERDTIRSVETLDI